MLYFSLTEPQANNAKTNVLLGGGGGGGGGGFIFILFAYQTAQVYASFDFEIKVHST